MGTVTVRLDGRPNGALVEVPDLGLFPNGETTDVEEGRWQRYQLLHPEFDGDEIVISTKQNREEAEEREEAMRALRGSDDLSDLNKDQLQGIARTVGVDPNQKKDDLVEDLDNEASSSPVDETGGTA